MNELQLPATKRQGSLILTQLLELTHIMKMLQASPAGEGRDGEAGGRTVVVGVKLDSPSRELLTWALVKVAQPGDIVVALHVLGNDGK